MKKFWEGSDVATQMPTNAAMGRKLRELREGRGIKREQIALALDMGSENWRHYEAGRTQLTVPMLPKIADAYGISLTELLDVVFDLRAASNNGHPSTTKNDDGITANYNYTEYRKQALAGVLTTEWDMGRGLVFRRITLANSLSHPVAQMG